MRELIRYLTVSKENPVFSTVRKGRQMTLDREDLYFYR